MHVMEKSFVAAREAMQKLNGKIYDATPGGKLTVFPKINFDDVPLIDSIDFYLKEKCIPGGTIRNFESYGEKSNELVKRKSKRSYVRFR